MVYKSQLKQLKKGFSFIKYYYHQMLVLGKIVMVIFSY